MRKVMVLLVSVVAGFLIFQGVLAANPPSSFQRNPDIYPCCGLPSIFSGTTAGDLQGLNPISQKLRGGSRAITYSYVVVPGCSDGNMQSTLLAALTIAQNKLGITTSRVSFGGDMAIRATCGVDASNVGLGAAICDVYPNWPYKSQVNCSTTMATFYQLSQVTIWLHEIVGHAWGTWNEQYQLDGIFSATPGLVDFMNTGNLSREEAWPIADTDRWERTMYQISRVEAPYQDCTTYPGWEPTVSCYWPGLGKWLWVIPLNGKDSLWEYDRGPWVCSNGCP